MSVATPTASPKALRWLKTLSIFLIYIMHKNWHKQSLLFRKVDAN